MISFERIDISSYCKEIKNSPGEINIFQTSEWLSYISNIHNAEPVIVAIKSSGELQGYFVGLLTRKFGIIILGSPFRGWQTYFMGFNLISKAAKQEILLLFPKFVFKELGCHYLELIDPNLSESDWEGSAYKLDYLQYYGIDLTKSEDDLFNNMDSTGRNCIRKSIKNGVVIEEVSSVNFADEYYEQYKDVLAKRSLSPVYSLNSVRKLIEYTLPTGNLLLLRAKSPEGISIATGIFLMLNKTAVFWGAASWRQYQHLRPNEPIAWHGMKAMKARGAHVLHFGGKCEHYKEKLGAMELPLYRLMKTKTSLLGAFLYPAMSPKNEEYRNRILKQLSR
jgi:hypothetical protein